MATIQQRGNSYKISVSCGYDLNGKQIRKTTTWKPEPGMTARQIKKELDRQAVLFEEKCRTGQVLDGNIKLADFAEMWFRDYAEKQLRPTTLRGYRQIVRRINAAIGHIRLDRLRPSHILQFYNNLAEVGIAARADSMHSRSDDLKTKIKDSGTTLERFAEQTGISVRTLRAACSGQNISTACAQKISDSMQMPVKELFARTRAERPLDAATIRKHHAVLSSILSTAVKWQIIPSNPCERVQPPKLERKEAIYLDEYQAAHLLELLQSEDIQHRTMITLLLFTGLRRGELCGLEWKDIDFTSALLQVRRTSLYLPEKGIFTDDTKNFSSQRVIKLPPSVLSLLREYYTWQLQERLKIGDQWHNYDRLFTQWNGLPIHPSSITGWFSDFISKTDLPPVHIHSLRHTNATLQIAGGVPITAVADRLGHASATTTGRVYAHAIQSANAAAAAVLEDMLHPSKKKKA